MRNDLESSGDGTETCAPSSPRLIVGPTATMSPRDLWSHLRGHDYMAALYGDARLSRCNLLFETDDEDGFECDETDDEEWCECESGVPVWNDVTRCVRVYGVDIELPKCWLVEGRPHVLADDKSRSIVYLHLPGSSRCAPWFTLHDLLVWMEGDYVWDRGTIAMVFYDEIVITTDGLLVPVLAELHRVGMAPFKVDARIVEEHSDKYALRFATDRLLRKDLVECENIPQLPREPQIGTDLDLSLGDSICMQDYYDRTFGKDR